MELELHSQVRLPSGKTGEVVKRIGESDYAVIFYETNDVYSIMVGIFERGELEAI